MPEKTGAEAVAQNIAEAKENAAAAAEEVKSLGEGVKALAENLKEGFASMKEIKETEEMKSLKSELERKSAEANNLKEKLKLADAGQGSIPGDISEEEVKSIQALASKLVSKDRVALNSEEYKSIRFTDASTTGGFIDSSRKMGTIDINKQPLATILEDVDVMPAVNSNEGSVVWDGFDESLVDMYDANEMDAAKLSEAVRQSLIKLSMNEVKSKMILSSRVIQNALAGGNQVATLNRNLTALESRYRRKLATKVFQDIIGFANGGKIFKQITTTTNTPADEQGRVDLRLFPSKLKVDYVSGSVMYVSRAFLNALFSKETADGHLATEQFVFTDSGITLYVTPEKAIPVKVFEHNQIGDYKSLDDGSTSITADYVSGGTNTGKLLAIVGDLNYAYKVIPSTMGTVGYDASISNIFDGAVPAGKISFAAQGVVAREAIKVLYSK